MSNSALMTSLPDAVRVAFYGSLFAMAAVDHEVDREEWALIFEQLDTEGLSPEAELKIKNFMLVPPDMETCLRDLAGAELYFRLGTMINLVDVAYADSVVVDTEANALLMAQEYLQVSDAERRAIEGFIQDLCRIRHRGRGDKAAQGAVRRSVEKLLEAGIPLKAVSFSSAFLYEPSLKYL